MDAGRGVDHGPLLDDAEGRLPVLGQRVGQGRLAGAPHVVEPHGRDVVRHGPDRQPGGAAAVAHLDGVLLGDQRHRLLLHVDEAGVGDQPQRLALEQHDAAGRPVAVADDADVAVAAVERVGQRHEGVEQDLGGVGDQDQVVVVVLGGHVAQDAAGPAVLALVPLDAERAVVLHGGRDRLGRGAVDHDADGQLLQPGHAGQLGGVVEPVVQDRPVLVQRQVEQAAADARAERGRADGPAEQDQGLEPGQARPVAVDRGGRHPPGPLGEPFVDRAGDVDVAGGAAARRNPPGATSTAGEPGAGRAGLAIMTAARLGPPSRRDAPRYAARPSRLAANGRPWTMYRLNSRRGSWSSRCAHSMPARCIHDGARCTSPVRKLKLTPTPSHHAAGSDGRSLAIRCSCLGEPRATKTMSGRGGQQLGDLGHLPGVLLEPQPRAVGADDADVRVPLPQHVGRPLGRPLGPAQQEHRPPGRRRRRAQRRDQVRPRHPLRQRRPLQLAGPHQGHAVGHDQVGLGHQGPEVQVAHAPPQVVQVRRDDHARPGPAPARPGRGRCTRTRGRRAGGRRAGRSAAAARPTWPAPPPGGRWRGRSWSPGP